MYVVPQFKYIKSYSFVQPQRTPSNDDYWMTRFDMNVQITLFCLHFFIILYGIFRIIHKIFVYWLLFFHFNRRRRTKILMTRGPNKILLEQTDIVYLHRHDHKNTKVWIHLIITLVSSQQNSLIHSIQHHKHYIYICF